MRNLIGLLLILFAINTAAQNINEKGIKWTSGLSWDQIKQKAKKENKYIFLDIYATWCGPCKEMDKKVYVNDSVGNYFNDKFISVKVQMDKTAKDDEQVRGWYNDATAIGKQYHITAFPSFVFLNPQGAVVDIQTGYQNVKQFVNLAQTATEPGKLYKDPYKRYDSLVTEYRRGNLNYNELPSMINKASILDTALRTELMKVHKAYVVSLPANERYTERNIQFWSSLNLGFQTSIFRFFLKDPEKIDQVMGYNGYAADVVDKMIYIQIVKPFLAEQNKRKEIPMAGMYMSSPELKADSSEADWKKLHKIIREQFNITIAKRNVLAARIEWYMRHFYYYAYCKYTLIQLNKYRPDVTKRPVANINTGAWNAFMHVTDKKILNGYVKWMTKTIQSRPERDYLMDTYANLLYKVGRKEDAIIWETKAVQMRGSKEELFKSLLETMKKGEPTYPGVAVWDGVNTVNWKGVKFSKAVIVSDANGRPVEGAVILNKRSGISKNSNEKGHGRMEVSLDDILVISSLGYDSKEVSITKEPGLIKIVLIPIKKVINQRNLKQLF